MQQRNFLMNYLLSEYQADILPLVAKVLVNMSKTERERAVNTCQQLFCGLHFLVGLADGAEDTIKVWEAKYTGQEQYGSFTLFNTYLRKKDIHKIPLANFAGNRFNMS